VPNVGALPGLAAGWESIERRVSDDLDCDSAARGRAGKRDGAMIASARVIVSTNLTKISTVFVSDNMAELPQSIPLPQLGPRRRAVVGLYSLGHIHQYSV
jgi:hypothetical protein